MPGDRLAIVHTCVLPTHVPSNRLMVAQGHIHVNKFLCLSGHATCMVVWRPYTNVRTVDRETPSSSLNCRINHGLFSNGNDWYVAITDIISYSNVYSTYSCIRPKYIPNASQMHPKCIPNASQIIMSWKHWKKQRILHRLKHPKTMSKTLGPTLGPTLGNRLGKRLGQTVGGLYLASGA